MKRRNVPTFVVVVREEGHWYVSAAYTALEYVRVYNNCPAPTSGRVSARVPTLGADSPDAAVQDAMRALQAQRLDEADDARATRRASRCTTTATQLLALAQRDEWKTTFTIDQLSTTSEMHGDTAKVTLHASGTTDSGRWSVDGGLLHRADLFRRPERHYVYCLPKAPVDIFDVFGATAPATADGPSQITVVQRDGRWFVSPVGTVLDVLNTWIRNIDRRGLYSLLHLPTELEPDGEIRLGEPVTVPGECARYARVHLHRSPR